MLELETTGGDGKLCVWLGDGNWNWVNSSTGLPTGSCHCGVACSDVDNDNDLDIAVTTSKWGVCVYRQNSDNSWTKTFSSLSDDLRHGIRLADINNDGYLDIVHPNKVYIGNGGTSWTLSGSGLGTSGYGGVDVSDIDNDGKLDLARGSYVG